MDLIHAPSAPEAHQPPPSAATRQPPRAPTPGMDEIRARLAGYRADPATLPRALSKD